MVRRRPTILFLCFTLLVSTDAHAYLDPGTGSLLFTAFLSIFTTLYFLGKSLLVKISELTARMLGGSPSAGLSHNIVIYSEGSQYWRLFKPVVDALHAKEVPITYWSSDETDSGLAYPALANNCEYIGTGMRAYARLAILEAKICVSTTPGLDVLQIKRSKRVQHYAHLIHAPTTGTYKLYSFDYFDSILCSGQHQIDALRELERKRRTPEKLLLATGCCYMDEMVDRLKALDRSTVSEEAHLLNRRTRVLVAPSWGENGLLTKFDSQIIEHLLAHDLEVTIRPHPNSYIVESGLLSSLKARFGPKSGVLWDSDPDPFYSLSRADILISDFSGIVFDFSFVFEKPVITVKFEPKLLGLDAADLDNGLWELRVLDEIGSTIGSDDLGSLCQKIESLVSERGFRRRIAKLRQDSIFNFGNAGDSAAIQLSEILHSIEEQRQLKENYQHSKGIRSSFSG